MGSSVFWLVLASEIGNEGLRIRSEERKCRGARAATADGGLRMTVRALIAIVTRTKPDIVSSPDSLNLLEPAESVSEKIVSPRSC